MLTVIKKIFKRRRLSEIFLIVLGFKFISNILSDKLYLEIKYYLIFHKRLNLSSPQTFNEKLQWLKLYDRNPLYTTLVDKYAVREYVKEKIGEEYLVPLYGVWDSTNDIDFDSLPNQFVLKTNHDCGGIVICKDKKNFDINSAKKLLDKHLKQNYYWGGREWPYKNVPPKIIAEKFLVSPKQTELIDFKFYCFNGIPQFLYISQGLSNHLTAQISFFDLQLNLMPFIRNDYAPLTKIPFVPTQFNKMKEIAKILSAGLPFLRVDLYEIEGHIYFSELTFTPCSGFMHFYPPEWDKKVGDMLILPTQKNV